MGIRSGAGVMKLECKVAYGSLCARLASSPLPLTVRLPMLKPHEIIAHLSPELSAEFFTHLQRQEKQLYKATIETLAKQRRFRATFIEKKQPAERHAWMKDALGRTQNITVAAHVLQIWFISAHKDLLCDFLDALKIEHDENGTVEQLPESPDKASLKAAVETLLAKHPVGIVAAYLHSFQALHDEQGWPPLEEILAEDGRLKL